MFKCLGWPCPATFIFCFRDTNRDTLVFLRPETRDVATRVSGRCRVSSKYGTCSERVVSQFMYVRSLTGVTYLCCTVLTSPKKGETAVHCCDPALSFLVMLMSGEIFFA